MGYENFSFVATGDINPNRFVAMAGTDFTVRQALATDRPIGISGRWTRRFDATLHATTGDTCTVAGEGETALLELGGTVVSGDLITPTTGGKGIKATSDDDVGAWAYEGGDSGSVIQVKVGKFTSAIS